MKKICVYKITNRVNNKIYIGSAIDFHRRKRGHFNLLRKGCHHSIKLQNSFNKYGEENFVVEVIELIDDVNILIEIEQKWLDELKPELNMTFVAGKQSALGRKVSDNTKEKIRKALTGKPLTEEHKKAIGDGLRGKKQTEKTKNNRSETLKKVWKTNENLKSKDRITKIVETRLNNGGYIVTDEMKKKISKTLKDNNLQSAVSIEIEKYDLEGNLLEVYPSMAKAEIDNNIGRSSLYYNLVKQGKEQYKCFIWKIKK